MKKKIFFLADSLVDLRFIFDQLKKDYEVKWVYYHKSLKKEILSSGYTQNDTIYISSNIFKIIFLKLLDLFNIKKLNYQNELNHKILEIDKKFKPEMWLTDTGNILSSIRTSGIKATFKHSVPYKKYFLSKNIFLYDYVFIPGNYHQERIENYYFSRIKELKKKLIITISPKILPYLAKKNDIIKKKDVFKDHGLEHNKRTILLATTHNSFNNNRILPENFGSELESLVEISKIVSKKYNFNFIVKPHHYHYEKFKKNKYLDFFKKRNIAIFKSNKNFDSLESEILIFNSDIIITDTSGVASTCSYLDKRIIYLNPDKPDWENSDIEENMRPGFVVSSIVQIDRAIGAYIKNPSFYQEERRDFKNKIFKYQNLSDLNKINEIIKKIV